MENLTVDSVTATSANLSWSLSCGTYQTPHSVLISYHSEGTEPQTISTDSCSAVITGLEPHTDYTGIVSMTTNMDPTANLQVSASSQVRGVIHIKPYSFIHTYIHTYSIRTLWGIVWFLSMGFSQWFSWTYFEVRDELKFVWRIFPNISWPSVFRWYITIFWTI